MGISQPFDVREAQPLVGNPAGAVSSKLLGLEMLRFASALAVLFYHYHHFVRVAGAAAVERSTIPFYAFLWPLYDYGQFGVHLFWGISGYIFFWKYGAAIHTRAVNAREFFWLRFSRLYPLHFATLIAVAALQSVHRALAGFDFKFPATDPWMFGRQLFLATDWMGMPDKSFNGPIWSISAEIAIYAVFFSLLRRVAPSSRLCVAVVVAALALQFAGLKWVSIECAAYFFAGGLAALAPSTWRNKAAICLAILIAGCAITGILRDRDQVPAIMLLALPCLLVLIARGWSVLDGWERQIQAAGNLTYASYLLNFPLQLVVATIVAATGIALPLTNPFFLLAYIGLTLAAAALCYRVLELPAQNWIRRKTLKRS